MLFVENLRLILNLHVVRHSYEVTWLEFVIDFEFTLGTLCMRDEPEIPCWGQRAIFVKSIAGGPIHAQLAHQWHKGYKSEQEGTFSLFEEQKRFRRQMTIPFGAFRGQTSGMSRIDTR